MTDIISNGNSPFKFIYMKPIQFIVGIALCVIAIAIFHDPDGPHFQSSPEIIASIISPILFVVGCIMIVMSFGKED